MYWVYNILQCFYMFHMNHFQKIGRMGLTIAKFAITQSVNGLPKVTLENYNANYLY